MIREAIILAGGFGTRLQTVVSEVPKPMADMDGRPFLHYLLVYLKKNRFDKIIFSVGYKADSISAYFGESYLGMEICYAREEVPLGTGGALKFALTFAQNQDVLVMNGDSFYNIDLQKLCRVHAIKEPSVTFSLKKLFNENRYGGLKIDDDLKITNFLEKDYKGEVYVNSGIYAINKVLFNRSTENLGNVFSLEVDYFSEKFEEELFVGVPYHNKYFLDIGIPEDYARAKKEIAGLITQESGKLGVLFLDRDGVINKKINNGYVLKWEQFEFKPDFIHFIQKHRQRFKKAIVITNQRCVGKRLISENELDEIHKNMIEHLKKYDVRVDKVYHCPDIDDSSPCRKPNTGMFSNAKKDYPEIELNRNDWFLGDSESDMIAGQRSGLRTILVSGTNPIKLRALEQADFLVKSLVELDSFFE